MSDTRNPRAKSPEAAAIAEINDRLRRAIAFGPGTATPLQVTPGVAELGEDMIASAVLAMAQLENFDPDLDPDGLHDLGAVDVFGTTIWFRFDIGPDGPDTRIVTLLLPEEY